MNNMMTAGRNTANAVESMKERPERTPVLKTLENPKPYCMES